MMLVAKEFALSPPAAVASRRRAPARVASWGFAPSGSGGGSPVGELWLRTRGGGGAGGTDGFGSHSHESDMDLAMLVSDFLENGGSGGADSRGSSDSESSLSDLAHLADKISMYKQGGDEKQNELLCKVHSLLFSIHESELLAFKRGQCSGGCIRHLLVKLLRLSGYDAAICVSKWQGFDKIPGGDHEYIDVMINNSTEYRLIIDIDFRSHFEIARAVDSYGSLLNSLPVVYVGTLSRLKQFLPVMVDAAKWSLQQNSMPLPPWRSLPYLQAKWYSKYERIDLHTEQDFNSSASDHALCIGHLKRLKSSLQSELDTERLHVMPIKTDMKRRAKFERRRRSLLSL
ncbi:hypothetical protein ABZP36_015184 [Zizania latifolia]